MARFRARARLLVVVTQTGRCSLSTQARRFSSGSFPERFADRLGQSLIERNRHFVYRFGRMVEAGRRS